MALGTTSEPKDNPRMPAPGEPGATPHSVGERDPSKPWLDPDDDKVDWVMLMRVHPHAKSKEDLRAAAMKAGAEVEKAAAEARANKDVPIEEQKGDPAIPAYRAAQQQHR